MDENVGNYDLSLRDKQATDNSLDVAYRRNLQADNLDFMSPVIEKIAGYSVQEMIAMGSIGKSCDLIHPDDLPLVNVGFSHAVDIGFGTIEYRFKHKDGKYRWFADHFMIIRDQNGKPLFSEGIMRDITEIKKA
ncbi:PAS domain-containing protein [uncultured Methanomethylovorans sp.]|uniref:PAS domain-containing protein n=1 Tax=uncultured Methanomethylovorans sp. TaxID=183759 RepID=UPI002AA7C310|nr:PAS domain-containing protein [uncultured Methanomethylovorans sp.]